MALHWSIAKVRNYKELIGPEGRVPDKWGEIQATHDEIVTKVIVFQTINIGMNEITASNAKEFYRRLAMCQSLWGPFVYKAGGEDYLITLADVERRIGLTTNANKKSKSMFDKQFREAYNEQMAKQKA